MSYKPVMVGPWYAEVRRLAEDSEREAMLKMSVEEREEYDMSTRWKESKWFNERKDALIWTSLKIRSGYHTSMIVPKAFKDNQDRAKQEAIVDIEYDMAIDSISEKEQLEYQSLTQKLLQRLSKSASQ